MKAPEHVETPRLLLRRPRPTDAPAIFERYASDREVTKYIGWSSHRVVGDSQAFVAFSDAEWERWPAGPYLVFLRQGGDLIGSSGLAFETRTRASTGYVLAKSAWGRGYATETLRAMIALAPTLGVRRLYALCHADHRASAHVLEKCDFAHEGILRRHSEFPNLRAGEPMDVLCYSLVF